MTKTVTTRMGQTKWSSGSDALRRVDLNGNADGIEGKSAIDDGTTYTTLPAPVDILRGRYVMFSSGAGVYTSLYRATTDGGAWLPAMGNTAPAPLTFRPHLAGDQATTDVAVALTHPSLASTYGKLTYDGQAQFARVTAWDPDSTARGTVYVGLAPATATDLTNLGRAHVRTRVAAERALVLQAHDIGAGNLLTVRESGGSDVVTVDSAGYLRARALTGLGGGAINAAAAVVVAPTSAGGDGVDTGLLLHGQSGATSKVILGVQRDLADTALIGKIERDRIQLGRLPWGAGGTAGSAELALAGRQVNLRAQGYDSDTILWRLRRVDYADPGNTTLDESVSTLSRASGLTRVPMTFSQALGTSAVNLTVQRYTDFNGRFLEFQRVTGGTEVITALEADGRLAVGARWKGTGVMRDARQPMIHLASTTSGGTYSPGQTFTYEWPLMQSRSVTAFDLKIEGRLEATIDAGAFSDREDGQQYFLNFDISINGGGYTFITSSLMGGPAHRSGTRPVNVQDSTVWSENIPAGATFQIRTRVFIGGAVPTVNLRKQWMSCTECVIADY